MRAFVAEKGDDGVTRGVRDETPRSDVELNTHISVLGSGKIRQRVIASFTPEEQIEYAASILTVETGDVFSCGTCGGVGQGTNTFLQPGDVMETEVESLGKMRNRFVAETA